VLRLMNLTGFLLFSNVNWLVLLLFSTFKDGSDRKSSYQKSK
jgi:hypothetical protein